MNDKITLPWSGWLVSNGYYNQDFIICDRARYVQPPILVRISKSNFFQMHYPISVSCRRERIKFCSSDKDSVAIV